MIYSFLLIFSIICPPRAASCLNPSKTGRGCLKLRQHYYLFKDSLEVCHHFPPPLVSLRHSQKEIIKECVSGCRWEACWRPGTEAEVITASPCNFKRVHRAGVATGEGLAAHQYHPVVTSAAFSTVGPGAPRNCYMNKAPLTPCLDRGSTPLTRKTPFFFK